MGRLSQIRKEIAAEHGYSSWAEFGVMESRMKLSIMHDEVARRYATEMVRHNLERASKIAHVELTVPKDTDLSKLEIEGLNISVEEVKNFKVRVSKESITSIEIELI